MNCPSKTDPVLPDGHNQSPNALAGDTTTGSDLGRMASARMRRDHRLSDGEELAIELETLPVEHGTVKREDSKVPNVSVDGETDGAGTRHTHSPSETGETMLEQTVHDPHSPSLTHDDLSHLPRHRRLALTALRHIKKYLSFIGPGFLISVAYIDPGNYATDVAAGATYQYRLLFMILLSNIFAIFLQTLCIRLGTVTGLNLAENVRAHCPRWLNYVLYGFAEAAIIATDIAEVIGTAIALNLLSNNKIPLVAGCAISIVDVLLILLLYRPGGETKASMRGLRAFEFGVMLLVIGVVVCFCIQLSLISGTTAGDVLKGYLPSHALVESQGLYQACGILGATVMPHSLYLGSGIIQARLQDFDRDLSEKEERRRREQDPSPSPPTTAPPRASDATTATSEDDDDYNNTKPQYLPSLPAIKSCMNYSILELAISLFTFALFVNSAILIVAGASLYNTPGAADADLFGIYHLLSTNLASAAGTIFALALLLSGVSAGIVCTIAGQMVSEGQLRLKVAPWMRRLITRSISITPSIIIAGAVGAEGLSAALEGSQVALSVILPFVSAPLIYFTCRNKYMSVDVRERGGAAGAGVGNDASAVSGEDDGQGGGSGGVVKMRNNRITAFFAVLIWLIIVVMNVALLVLVGTGAG